MQGERVDELRIKRGGVAGDRSYALLDLQTGRVASAHHPGKWGLLLHCSARWAGDPDAGGEVVVTLPDGTEERAGPHLEHLLSRLLGRQVGLIREAPQGGAYEILHPDIAGVAPDTFVERTLQAAGVRDGRIGQLALGLDAPRGALVDVSPVHLVSLSSHRALAAEAGAVDLRRFRANLVLEGRGREYVEGSWTGARLTAGEVKLTVTMPTPRCVMTTLAQAGLPADPRPLRTLASGNRLDLRGGAWACFGSYAGVESPGALRVGDEVQVTTRAQGT